MYSKEIKLKYPWRRYEGKRILRGYVQVWAPKYKRAKHQGWCNGYIAEHIIVMQGLLGRLLKEGEIVHHLDGNKLNNDPINLELMTRARHTSLHLLGKKKTEEHKKNMSLGKQKAKAKRNLKKKYV